MKTIAKRWMFAALVALSGCDSESDAMTATMAHSGPATMGAAGSAAFGAKPDDAAGCPKLSPISGIQLSSCCQPDGMCGLDGSALGRGCMPYSSASLTGFTPPPPTKCSASSTSTGSTTSTAATGSPSVMEPATTVYVEQSSQVLAGGGLELRYDFVLLFGDGWSTWRMGLAALEMPAADRAAEPEAWVKWRRDAQGRPERLLKGDQWTLVPGAEYKASAPGRTLNAEYVYRQTFSGGSVSKFLTFKANGQFESTNFVSSTSSTKQGTYRIDGFVLTLTFSDGQTAKHTLVISSDEEMIILNGTSYVR